MKHTLAGLEAVIGEIGGLQKRLKELQSRRAELERELLKALEDSGLESIQIVNEDGKRIRYAPTNTVLPKVEDWDALYEWIRDNNAFFVLHRRVSATAVRELAESEETPPGVELVEIVKLNRRST